MDENRKKFRIYRDTRIQEHGKQRVPAGPRQEIKVDHGFKCEHGVYIPPTAVSDNHAPFCTLCYPYIVTVKEKS